MIHLLSEFTSGLIQRCIPYVIRTGKILLNVPTSYGRNIRHIFFESKILCSCRRMSIIQYNMCNHCNGLFTCVINYLHVLCMIFMILSCVICMTLMVFIYVYYRLFACTNLVDVMSLFFTVFSFHLPIFHKNRSVFGTNCSEIAHRFSEKPPNLSVFLVSLFVSSAFRPNFSDFH
jgi:hypothetical protein